MKGLKKRPREGSNSMSTTTSGPSSSNSCIVEKENQLPEWPARLSSPLDDVAPSVQANKRKKSMENIPRNNDMIGVGNLFVQLLTAGGFPIDWTEMCITIDMIHLRRSIERRLLSDKAATAEFINGMMDYFQDDDSLRRCLLPTSLNQDCLIRVFLSIDSLQQTMIDILLQRLPLYIDMDKNLTARSNSDSISWLILSQFRWLENPIDSLGLTNQLLDTMMICEPNLQKEIISFIPEIVNESNHSIVVESLLNLQKTDASFTVLVLEAITNLNVDVKLLNSIIDSILPCLSSASLEDLPGVLKFFLQNATNENVETIITHIRKHLNISSLCLHSRNNRKEGVHHSNKSSESLILDSILCGIRFKSLVVTAWLKIISAAGCPADLQVLDMWLIFTAYSIPLYKKRVETVLKKKISARHINVSTLQQSINGHSNTLKHHFSSLLAMCDFLMRSTDLVIMNISSVFYEYLFRSFHDPCLRQEILGAIICHIGSRNSKEMDGGLDCLVNLALRKDNVSSTEACRLVSPFATFIKGILDYLDDFSDMQLRKVFLVFASLRDDTHSGSVGIDDEIHIVIRKQLFNVNPRYKRIGVLGASTVIKMLSTVNSDNNDGNSLINAKTLVDMVLKGCQGSPSSLALFYDELSQVVEFANIDRQMIQWINDELASQFESVYIGDLDENRKPPPLSRDNIFSSCPVHIKAMFNLDGNESVIAINIIPLLLDSNKSNALKYICQHFGLMQTCERTLHERGSLEQIDALLGCPIYFFDAVEEEDYIELSSAQKDILCHASIVTLCWFREIVNAYSTQSTPDIVSKVFSRLRHIRFVETQLDMLLKHHLSFSIEGAPKGFLLAVDKKLKGTKVVSEKLDKTNKKKKLKKSHEKVVDDVDLHGPTKPMDAAEDKLPYLQALRPYLRDKSSGFVEILKFHESPLSRSLDARLYRLLPPDLYYALKDLKDKLMRNLFPKKKMPFGKSSVVETTEENSFSPDEFMTRIIDVIPNLKKHLFTSIDCIRASMGKRGIESSDCDDIEDMLTPSDRIRATEASQLEASGDIDEARAFLSYLEPCVVSCIECLTKLFKWQSNEDDEQSFLCRLQKLSGKKDLNTCLSATFDCLFVISENFPSGQVGVCLVEFLSSIVDPRLHPSILTVPTLSAMRIRLSEMSRKCLSKQWSAIPLLEPIAGVPTPPCRLPPTAAYVYFLRQHIRHSQTPLEVIEFYTTTVVNLFTNEINIDTDEKSNALEVIPILGRSNFPIFFKAIFSEMVSLFSLMLEVLPDKRDTDATIGLFKRIQTFAECFKTMTMLCKSKPVRPVVSATLRSSREILDVFLSRLLPFMNLSFNVDTRSSVASLLQEFQPSTRFLQHLCNHCKSIKDDVLTSNVPFVRRNLEKLLFKVKSMLVTHNCAAAWWAGNLKHRDLHGKIVDNHLYDDEEIRKSTYEVEDAPSGLDDDATVESDSGDGDDVDGDGQEIGLDDDDDDDHDDDDESA